jgi:hypothetical protein
MALIIAPPAALFALKTTWSWPRDGSFLHQFEFAFLIGGLGYIGVGLFMFLRGTGGEQPFRDEPRSEGRSLSVRTPTQPRLEDVSKRVLFILTGLAAIGIASLFYGY